MYDQVKSVTVLNCNASRFCKYIVCCSCSSFKLYMYLQIFNFPNAYGKVVPRGFIWIGTTVGFCMQAHKV